MNKHWWGTCHQCPPSSTGPDYGNLYRNWLTFYMCMTSSYYIGGKSGNSKKFAKGCYTIVYSSTYSVVLEYFGHTIFWPRAHRSNPTKVERKRSLNHVFEWMSYICNINLSLTFITFLNLVQSSENFKFMFHYTNYHKLQVMSCIQ